MLLFRKVLLIQPCWRVKPTGTPNLFYAAQFPTAWILIYYYLLFIPNSILGFELTLAIYFSTNLWVLVLISQYLSHILEVALVFTQFDSLQYNISPVHPTHLQGLVSSWIELEGGSFILHSSIAVLLEVSSQVQVLFSTISNFIVPDLLLWWL